MSDDLARAILGGLILRPELLETSDLTEGDFPDGRLRQTFQEISRTWAERQPREIDPVLLSGSIGGNGAAAFVGSLVDGQIRLEPDAFRGRVLELRRRAITRRIRARLRDQDTLPEIDLSEIRPDLEALDRLRENSAAPPEVFKTGAELQSLDISVSWVVDRLLPARSLTLLHSRGGLGKSWLSLAMAKAVSAGSLFLGLSTQSRPVFFIDFENPLPLLVERVRLLDIRDVRFWHISNEIPPPRLDHPDWELYKKVLIPGSLVIFDTLRASHLGDENSSQDAALVLSRLKEIRELGIDVLILHHTSKLDDRRYKGSTAFIDLADHVLDFHAVRRGSLEEVDEDAHASDTLFSLGTGEKSRFAPFRIYLSFDPATGTFQPADDPDQDALNVIQEHLGSADASLSQTELYEWSRDSLGLSKKGRLVSLLQKGERRGLWSSNKSGRMRLYHAI